MSTRVQVPHRAAVATPAAPLAANVPARQRIPALDFTKGALVLIMVLYHWINYFIGPQWKYYIYLRFLTPSFICITGFMVSHVYLAKYTSNYLKLSGRLVMRGLKLLAIFLALNLARDLIVPILGTGTSIQGMLSTRFVVEFFILGNLPVDGPKLISFSILVPISYLLMVSGVLVLCYSRYKYTFHVACFALLLASVIVGYTGPRNYNMEFVAIGLLGVVAGFASHNAIEFIGRWPHILLLAYAGYLILITIWNVPFLFLIVAVLLNLCILYLIGNKGDPTSAVRSEVILLGKYSLFGYIAQVAILQLLSKSFQHLNLRGARLPGSFLAALVLTVLSVELLDRARAGSKGVDRIYKAIFA